jgi:2-polyprenyl-6-hydroxyphenyl methylase/3-demethylubiquinone-9 3-methyltransferase
VDQKEVKKFANLNWWGRNNDNSEDDAARALKNMHDARVNAIRHMILSSRRMRSFTFDKPGGFTALDVGCGGGIMTSTLKADFKASRVIGIDASSSGIEAARSEAKRKMLDIEYQLASPEELTGSNQKFDLVCALEVVEHVSDRDKFLKACAELCDGVMIVSTMNRTLASWALAIGAAEHLTRMVPRGTHDWRKFVTVEEIEDSLIHSPTKNMPRLHTEGIVGLVYNPFFRTWSASPNNDLLSPICNYVYFASK